MGSATVSNAKPQLPMAENYKKSFRNKLKQFFGKGQKKDKGKNETVPEDKTENTKANQNPVASLLENFQKLEIERTDPVKPSQEDGDDDEADNFTVKVIEDDRRSCRVDSHSSEDSGFVDVKETDDVIESLAKLKIEEKPEKKKKLQTVVLSRKPVRGKVSNYNAHPYSLGQTELADISQISRSQVNQNILSGGQLIVNQPTADNYSVVDKALQSVKKVAENSQQDTYYWDDVLDIINDDTPKKDDILSGFPQIEDQDSFQINIVHPENSSPERNPIEEFTNHLNYDNVELSTILNFDDELSMPKEDYRQIFPTPPRSENVPSPMSESQTSFYPSNSDYTLSPERSPIYNSDYEKYQEITHYEEHHVPDDKDGADKDGVEKKERERTASISSMTMKQFKDMQKEIAHNFSKKECCQVNRKSCRDILQEHMQKLKMADRKNLCFKVSKLDLKTADGVLHHILLSLSRGSEQEDLQYSLFGLICERVLAQTPSLFTGDFGLGLLKSAALRCPHRPILTRYLVQCIRTALKLDSSLVEGKECVFQEVDIQGDNLVTACARLGDPGALVLAEICRDNGDQLPPLFRKDHTNADGYTALHVACSQHSAAAPRLLVVHALLEHAQANALKGDLKGGDTALHIAVNSANCDLKLVMMIFKQFDRKLWRKLAHTPNMSSVTPLEYARSATKSSTRTNYPQEVLDFLKKCR